MRMRGRLLLPLLVAATAGCSPREQVADIVNQAIPLREVAFVTVDPGALGDLASLLRLLLIPAAILALWTVLQQYRQEEEWGERLASILEWALLLVLLGAPLVMLGGVDQIGRAVWPPGLTADWIRHDVLKWRLPGVESGGVDWNAAAVGVALATLMAVPGWHAALELLGLALFPLALIFSLFVRGLRPLAAWLAGFAIWVFFAPMWQAGLTLLAATPGNVDNHFALFTAGLMALIPLAQGLAVFSIIFGGGRPQVRLSPATRQMAYAILAERFAEGGGGGQAAPAAGVAGGPGGNPGNPGNPGPPSGYLALPPPSGGSGGSGSPPPEPASGPNGHGQAAGTAAGPNGQGPVGQVVNGVAKVAGVTVTAAATAEGLPPPAAVAVGKAAETVVAKGPLGSVAGALDKEQTPQTPQDGILPPVTEGRNRPPEEEAAATESGGASPGGRAAAGSNRRYAYATADVVDNGRVVCRRGQILFPDSEPGPDGGLVVDGVTITPDQYTWRG